MQVLINTCWYDVRPCRQLHVLRELFSFLHDAVLFDTDRLANVFGLASSSFNMVVCIPKTLIRCVVAYNEQIQSSTNKITFPKKTGIVNWNENI